MGHGEGENVCCLLSLQKACSILITFRKHKLTWTNLAVSSKTVGLLDGVKPVPEISGVQFIVATQSSPVQQLFQSLELGDSVNSVGMIQNYIIPAWQSQESENWTSHTKEQISDFIFGHFSVLSLLVQSKLRSLAMVPVAQLKGKETSTFALASQLLDPSVLELTGLCFDDEGVIPKESFFHKYKFALRGCGLKTVVDEDVVLQRVRCYAR